MNIQPLHSLTLALFAGLSLTPNPDSSATDAEFTPAEIAAAYNVIAKGAQVAVQSKDCITAAAYVDVYVALSAQYPASANVKQYMAGVNAACPPDPSIGRIVQAKREGKISHRQVDLLLQTEGLTDAQLDGLELVILKQKNLFQPEKANGVELQQWKAMERELAR